MKLTIRCSRPRAARCDLGRPGSNLLVPAFRPRGSLFPYIASAGLHVTFVAAALVIPISFLSPPETLEQYYRAELTLIRLRKQDVHLPVVPQSELAGLADRLRTRATELVSQMNLERNGVQQPSTPLPEHPTDIVKPVTAILFQPKFPLDLPPPPTSPPIPSVLVWTKEVAWDAMKRLSPPVAVQQEASSPKPATPPEAYESPVAPPEARAAATNTRAIQLLSLATAPVVADTFLVPPGNLLPPAAAIGGIRPGQTGGSAAPGGSSIVQAAHEDSLYLPSPSSANTPVTLPTLATGRSAEVTAEPIDAVQAPVPGLFHPLNGRFDVVVIQTSMDESLPPGLLTGKPVYTVYLPVGDTKEWTMHYCASLESVVQRGSIVQLPDPRPLDAPYPRLTFRPAEAIIGSGSYVLVYGVVDERGSFQNLRVVGLLQSGKSSLLDALRKWRFRPAMRAGSPAPVEMVLSIPVSKS